MGEAAGLYTRPVFVLSLIILLFQLVFDMLVLQKHNTEMTTAAGEAFYTLVCLHQVLRTACSAPDGSPVLTGPGLTPCSSPVRPFNFMFIGQGSCQLESISSLLSHSLQSLPLNPRCQDAGTQAGVDAGSVASLQIL